MPSEQRALRISLGALRHNATILGELVGRERAAFVVKGNAYGHGLAEVAKAIEPLAARLCVFALDEAIALREAGITAPILVLGPVETGGIDALVGAKLEIALWNLETFAAQLDARARAGNARAKVHIKVNTDLNRLGIEPSELPNAIERLEQLDAVQIAGIFSHLAAAEEIDSPYTMHQLHAFERALALAEPKLEVMVRQAHHDTERQDHDETERRAHDGAMLRHIAASAAAMLWPQTRLDMVRFGIALYGLWPSPQTREAMHERPLDLRPALEYHSKLVVVRDVNAGASVGYGGSFHAPHDMRIGVVPAGYADGVPRALSNRGAFAVDGALCPIVGRVAMNMTQLDLTNAPNAHAGSKVTLIGRDHGAEVSADDWAQWAETINYEIVTRLPAELPRVYVG